MTPKQARALLALDAAPAAELLATAKAQTTRNLNATVARSLLKEGWIQRAPWRDHGETRAWTFTDAGVDALAIALATA